LTSVNTDRQKLKDTLPESEDAKTAMRTFEKSIQTMRLEILKDLDAIDPLNSGKVEALQKIYTQKIITLQTEFLEILNHNGKFQKIKFDKGKDGTYYAEVAGAAVGGAGVGAVVAFIPAITVTTTTWGIWATTTTVAIGSLGTTFAADIFISGGIITLTAIAGGVAYYLWTKEGRREKVRNAILADFDYNTSPMMRAWANVIIRESLKPQPEAAQ
jgi:hypothetical protein